MRIAIGQLWQETNTFNPLATTKVDFEHLGLVSGDALIESMSRTNELGGFLQELRGWPEKPEVIGLIRFPAWPGGTATSETFDWILEGFSQAVRDAGQIDGVLLALHGAMAAVGHPDVEGAVWDEFESLSGLQFRWSQRSICTRTSRRPWSRPPMFWCCTTRCLTSIFCRPGEGPREFCGGYSSRKLSQQLAW